MHRNSVSKCCNTDALSCRVHGANKLAAKHDRVELGKAAEPVQCDICQDRPAVLFCSEDRALICRRCTSLPVCGDISDTSPKAHGCERAINVWHYDSML